MIGVAACATAVGSLGGSATSEPAPARSRQGIGGPKTAEGKSRAARNALKHGLRARTLMPEDLQAAAAQRTADFTDDLQPETPYQEWLIAQAALASAKLDRCAEMSVIHQQRRIDRVADFWDEDARVEIEDLGARLPRDPARVFRALTLSIHGLDWLVSRWEGLANVARHAGAWDDSQRRLALDLLGIPHELRDGWADLSDDAPADDLIAFATRQRDELNTLRARLEALDETARTCARLGMPLHDDAPSRALKRYEADCRRILRWALAEFRRLRDPSPSPALEAAPPAPRPPAAPRRRPESPPEPEPRRAWDEADLAGSDDAADFSPARYEPRPEPAPLPLPPVGNRRARRYQAKLARQAGFQHA